MPSRSIGCGSPWRRKLACAALGATLACALSFSLLPGTFPPAIVLLPMALAAVGASAPSLGAAWRWGLTVSLPGYSLALTWVMVPVQTEGGLPFFLAAPCPVLLGALLAAYAGLFSFAVFFLKDHAQSPWTPMTLGAVWASLELGRGVLFTGFPWLVLAQALVPWPWTLGLARWIGAFGLSGMLAAAGSILVLWTGRRRLWALVPAGIMLLPLAFPLPEPLATLTAALVQGNIDQGQKWDPTLQEAILDTYLGLSRQAAQNHPDLIIWPETATPFHPQDPGPLVDRLHAEAASWKTPLLFGAPAYSLVETAPPTYVLHNRAYLLGRDGKQVAWYDKEHLVPFGEYVPWGNWLPFLSKLVPGDYEFAPSAATAPLPLSRDVRLGVLICYEAIFPELARDRIRDGASILVNISNDAWFGDSAAPRQHLALTALRAVESGRAIFRATNTGITAAIAPDGTILKTLPQFTPSVLVAELPVLTSTTVYHQHFWRIHGAFMLIAVGGLLVRFLRPQLLKRKHHHAAIS
ncbi:apolipoprotein N-acyltransferase [Thermodesulfomicrobium sp. WS]|uniref:apolipoprotein N-acyltransferase n=1 Tax=Thermodesulfomicrobium sp. WS TaxID=3004129 RepID=UPI00249284ED|nr:apolipoprotein N-acyltransferase [Thermodesulfomicrobium sp. WS]BDV01013.1 apolipoprotein N-acyltransferase [Thermodesulfomicrobium sp. WS]